MLAARASLGGICFFDQHTRRDAGRRGLAVVELAAFLGVAAVVIMTPGQDTLLLIRNTLAGGRRAGITTAIGVAAGQLTWAVATAGGVVALIAAFTPAVWAIQLFGAVYLGYLGLQALLGAARSDRRDGETLHRHRASLSPNIAFRHGLISNLSNPKMVVFFPSLLPRFAPGGADSLAGLVGLGLVFSLMTLVWLSSYVILLGKFGDLLRRPIIRRALEGLSGSILVLAAAALLLADLRA